MSNILSTHASQARESARQTNGQFGAWESKESELRLSATAGGDETGPAVDLEGSEHRLVADEPVGDGDPLTIDDGLVSVEVTAHGNFEPDSRHINVDNGEGLILAVKREELRRRPV